MGVDRLVGRVSPNDYLTVVPQRSCNTEPSKVKVHPQWELITSFTGMMGAQIERAVCRLWKHEFSISAEIVVEISVLVNRITAYILHQDAKHIAQALYENYIPDLLTDCARLFSIIDFLSGTQFAQLFEVHKKDRQLLVEYLLKACLIIAQEVIHPTLNRPGVLLSNVTFHNDSDVFASGPQQLDALLFKQERGGNRQQSTYNDLIAAGIPYDLISIKTILGDGFSGRVPTCILRKHMVQIEQAMAQHALFVDNEFRDVDVYQRNYFPRQALHVYLSPFGESRIFMQPYTASNIRWWEHLLTEKIEREEIAELFTDSQWQAAQDVCHILQIWGDRLEAEEAHERDSKERERARLLEFDARSVLQHPLF